MPRLRLISLIYLLCCLTQSFAQSIDIQTSSRHLLVGEAMLLKLTFNGEKPSSTPDLKTPAGLKSQFAGQSQQFTQTNKGRNRSYVYRYQITAVRPGKHTIPALSFTLDKSRELHTPAVDVQVYRQNTVEIKWQTAKSGNSEVSYGLATIVPNKSPYEGQAQALELKIYIPRNVRVDASRLMEVSTEGLNVQRFEPSMSEARGFGQPTAVQGIAHYKEKAYKVITYRAIASTRSSGEARIGSSTNTLRVGLPSHVRQHIVELPLDFPVVKLNSRALPPNAPDGFQRSVGRFNLKAVADLKNSKSGDPISIDLTVSGEGNLDIVKSPTLSHKNGWKTYPSVKVTTGDIRMNALGTVQFTQLILPTKPQTEIPPYRFVYFDTGEEKYKVLLTKAIPLPKHLQSAVSRSTSGEAGALPTTPSMPIEAMTEVLGLIPTSSSYSTWPAKAKGLSLWWHLVPGLALIGIIATQYFKSRRSHQTGKQLLANQEARLRKLIEGSQNDIEFFRASGQFIESSPRISTTEELQPILKRRDELCFDPEAKGQPLPEEERNSTISTIRQALLKTQLIIVACLSLILAHQSKASEIDPLIYDQAEQAWQKKDFQRALDLYLETNTAGHYPVDDLYNIGTCYAALGQDGLAALYYRRALALSPSHPESRQNLRFIERKNASLVFSSPEDWRKHLTKASRPSYFTTISIGGWAFAFSLLAIKRRWKLRLTIVTATLSFVTTITAATLLYLYPQEGDFSEINDLSLVIESNVSATNAPIANSKKIIELPQASLVRVLTTRGDWSYIEVAANFQPSVQARLQPEEKDSDSSQSVEKQVNYKKVYKNSDWLRAWVKSDKIHSINETKH